MGDNLYPSALIRIRSTEFRLKRRLAWLQRGVASWFDFPRSHGWLNMRFSALHEQMWQAILLFGREAWAQGWDTADRRIARDKARRRFDDKKPEMPDAPPIPDDWLNWYKGTTDEALSRYTKRIRRDIELEITTGVTEGKTHAETSAAIRDLHRGMTGWQAERISRTEMMRLWNMGHFGRMETEDEGLVGYEYSVVMDDRTSHICRPLAGLKVRRDSVLHLPPLHPHCRTLLEPIWDFDQVTEEEYGDPASPATVPGFGAVPRAPGVPRVLPIPPYVPVSPPAALPPVIPVAAVGPTSSVPMFTSVEHARDWMGANITENIILPPRAKAEGLQVLSETIVEVNRRFGLGKLYYIGDPDKFKHKVRFGSAWAAFITRFDSIIFKSRGTDMLKVAETYLLSNTSHRGGRPMESVRDSVARAVRSGRFDPRLVAVADALPSRGWTMVDDVRTIGYHELGHRMEAEHSDKSTLVQIAATAYRRGWSFVLSGYADTKLTEFIAESFCAYMKGETSILNPEMLAWFKSHDRGPL